MKSPLRFLDDVKASGLKAFRLLQTFHQADSKKKIAQGELRREL